MLIWSSGWTHRRWVGLLRELGHALRQPKETAKSSAVRTAVEIREQRTVAVERRQRLAAAEAVVTASQAGPTAAVLSGGGGRRAVGSARAEGTGGRACRGWAGAD